MWCFCSEYYYDRIFIYDKYYKICAYCAQSLKYYDDSVHWSVYVYSPVSRTKNVDQATEQSTMLFLASKHYIIIPNYALTLLDRELKTL